MYKVFVLDDDTWRKIAEYDQIVPARQIRDHYREDGYTTEIVTRLPKGEYYVIPDVGDPYRLGTEPHTPTAA